MSRLKIIVHLVEYDEKFVDIGRYEYKYTPINYVLACLNSLGSVKATKETYTWRNENYKIIIKSKLKKNDLRQKILNLFAIDEKLSKGCIIEKIK